MNRSTYQLVLSAAASALVCAVIFYLQAYYSVSDVVPGSVPVHHDDYTNYSAGGAALAWSWNRPVSNYFIHLLGIGGPEWLSGAIRVLSIVFGFLGWIIFCQLTRPRAYWLLLPLFIGAVFSTPVIAEYARYTGMITHLTSGCLGLMAVAALFRASGARFRPATTADDSDAHTDPRWILASAVLLVLSAFAKEDFVLLYALSLVYSVLRWPRQRAHLLIIGGIGLAICAAAIVASKLLAASAFLGVASKASSYYFNISPVSIATTVSRYLQGAGHPAMLAHGQVLIAVLTLATLIGLGLSIVWRRIPATGYFVAAVLALIVPYAVLPNHVNAYYELIWLPMLVAAAAAAAIELTEFLPAKVRFWLPVAVLALLFGALSKTDFSGRASIAAWYDARSADNAKVLAHLQAQHARINEIGHVCVVGAEGFSPWYMHDGRYLERVMDLHATWHVFEEQASPYRAGFAMVAAPGGRITLVDSTAEFPADCVYINLQQGH